MKATHITNIDYQDFKNTWYYVTYPTVRKNCYAINLFGNIMSLKKNREKILQIDFAKGYMTHNLLSNNNSSRKVRVSVSRLVAWEFVGQPEKYKKLQVNHADGHHYNNYYKNLEWVTPEENIVHKVKYRLTAQGENHGVSNHKEIVVSDIIKYIDEGLSAPEISVLILKKYPEYYEDNKNNYDRLRGLVSKINKDNSWYNLKYDLKGSTTIENIIYEKHIGEEVSRVGLHPIEVDYRKNGHIYIW